VSNHSSSSKYRAASSSAGVWKLRFLVRAPRRRNVNLPKRMASETWGSSVLANWPFS
jgi:hypothetical protein